MPDTTIFPRLASRDELGADWDATDGLKLAAAGGEEILPRESLPEGGAAAGVGMMFGGGEDLEQRNMAIIGQRLRI